MGQRQSTNNAAEDEPPAKSDYYDLLGVERTATDDEIKKAYRRKALELHPDRNYGNVDETTKLFAAVQSAYEVLSDPQERAWYDSHKDVLLRGDQNTGAAGEEFSYNIRMTTTEDVLKLMMKFNGRVEFNDAPSGFFGGLDDFFKQLAKEEDIACQWENEESMEYPEFGHKKDEYEDVVRPFYSAWTGFATRKSYAWKDQYRPSDAPDRRIRRLMEKENKKIREEAIQEYNEAVRSMIAFVRKRDPRVQNNQKSEVERQKALREAVAAQAARSRAAREAQLQGAPVNAIPDWAQSRTRDEHEGGFSSESEVEEHEYDCVVCDKTFKSEAQFKAHEKSKKHVKLLKQLKKEMRDEGADLNLEGGPPATEHEDVDADGDELPDETNQLTLEDAQDLEDDSDGTATLPEKSVSSEVKKEDDASESSIDGNDDYAPRSNVEERLAGQSLEKASVGVEDLSLSGTPVTSDPEGPSQPKLGRAKQKRAKKAAQKSNDQPDTPTAEFQCAMCKAEFPSKTRLFSHLKENPKHAAPLTQIKGVKSGKGKKR